MNTYSLIVQYRNAFLRLSKQTLAFEKRHSIRQNDIQHSNTQHRLNCDTELKDTQRNELNYDTKYK